MSYAKSLRNTLRDKSSTLFNRLEEIEKVANSILIYTVSKFPYYTPHTFLHNQNVEENLNWIVTDEAKTQMNDCEVFFLLIAAWLHDWGMVASKGEEAEDVRKNHHIRTENNFETFYDKVHLSAAEARIVGRICRGHRDEDLFGQEYKDTILGSNVHVSRVSSSITSHS